MPVTPASVSIFTIGQSKTPRTSMTFMSVILTFFRSGAAMAE